MSSLKSGEQPAATTMITKNKLFPFRHAVQIVPKSNCSELSPFFQKSLQNFYFPIPMSANRLFHTHTKLPIMALMPTLYSHIIAVFFIIGCFNFEWYGLNEVGKITIPVLWRDSEKLYWLKWWILTQRVRGLRYTFFWKVLSNLSE